MSTVQHCLSVSGIIFLLVLAGSNTTKAATITVPGQKPTIQSAIDAAVNGDTVLVAAGTYKENLNFHGKAITVTSASGPASTIIDGNKAESVVAFVSGEGLSSVLNGFTIQNGLSTFNTLGFGDGGGILIKGSSPTISNNIISSNQGCDGLGISIQAGSSIISGNIITGNTRFGCGGGVGGGGISILGAGPGTVQIVNNIISNNLLSADGGGISMFAAGSVLISGNLISGNGGPATEGGGISMVNGTSTTIVNNVIVNNHADIGGGVFWLLPSGFDQLLVNNTIANNDARQGSAVHANSFDGKDLLINNILVAPAGQSALFCNNFNTTNTVMIKSSDVFTPGGGSYGGICSDQTGINGNISVDPGFLNPGAGDYHLFSTSKCIDAGNNSAPGLPAKDFDGNARVQDGNADGLAVVDMGAFEFPAPAPPFDICMKDDSTGNTLQFNSVTGAYKFTRCSDQFTLTGQGVIRTVGSILSLTDSKPDRRISAGFLINQLTGTATILLIPAPGISQTIAIKSTSRTKDCSCSQSR